MCTFKHFDLIALYVLTNIRSLELSTRTRSHLLSYIDRGLSWEYYWPNVEVSESRGNFMCPVNTGAGVTKKIDSVLWHRPPPPSLPRMHIFFPIGKTGLVWTASPVYTHTHTHIRQILPHLDKYCRGKSYTR